MLTNKFTESTAARDYVELRKSVGDKLSDSLLRITIDDYLKADVELQKSASGVVYLSATALDDRTLRSQAREQRKLQKKGLPLQVDTTGTA